MSTLGLEHSRKLTNDDIKRAFKKIVAQVHPDKQGGDEKRFRSVMDAYVVLTKAEKATATVDAAHEDSYGAHIDPENWRWKQGVGYDPSDLNDVWDEIGFNPYTGEYHEQTHHEHHQWHEQAEASWTAPEPDAQYYSDSRAAAAERMRHASEDARAPRAAVYDNDILMNIMFWMVVVVGIIMYAVNISSGF